MPVELPIPIGDTTPPEPPRSVVWLTAATVIMAGNVILTLVTWPAGEPTNTEMFWLRLLVFPALFCSFIYGLRLLYYEQETDRLAAEHEVLTQDQAKAIEFAQHPLAVLGSTYLCAFDGNAAEQIVARQRRLEARRPAMGKAAVRHTALTQICQAPLIDRYRSCFQHLLHQQHALLQSLPVRVPLDVHLQLPALAPVDDIRTAWQDCWQTARLRPVDITMLAPDRGVMALDTWLDHRGGPALEKFSLFVAVQLHDTPPANSAEAAVALLLGWAPLAERKGLALQALLHRPVEDIKSDVTHTLSQALLWGKAAASEVGVLWQAGLGHNDRSALMQASADLLLALEKSTDANGIHDVDAAIGHAGVASAWLALALAAESVSQTKKPQALASRESTLRVAVVQPVALVQQSESGLLATVQRSANR